MPVAYAPHGGEEGAAARAMIAEIDGKAAPVPPKLDKPGEEKAGEGKTGPDTASPSPSL